MIATHNFMHFFPAPKENEFEFNPGRFGQLLHIFFDDPGNIPRASLSYFGHYGVQIFILLSAYGLTKKYSQQKPIYWSFIWDRILKIYPGFILAILVWATIVGWLGDAYGLLGPIKVLYWNLESIILKLTLLSNFFPSQAFSLVGPWWFISFVFQFYFAFPLLLYLYSRWGGSVLLILAVLSICFSMLIKGVIGDISIYLTILGHLPELCLGMFLAKRDDVTIRIPASIIVVAAIIFLLGNIYATFWYVSHISFLILLLAAFNYVIPKIKSKDRSSRVFLFFGAISMQLFLVNGFLREPFILWANAYNNWLLTIALCLLSLMVSASIALAMFKLENYLRRTINKKVDYAS